MLTFRSSNAKPIRMSFTSIVTFCLCLFLTITLCSHAFAEHVDYYIYIKIWEEIDQKSLWDFYHRVFRDHKVC